MAHSAQAPGRRRLKTAFHQQPVFGRVRHGGLGAVADVLPAGRFHSLLHRHSVVNQVGDDLHIALHLAVGARRAQDIGQAPRRGGAYAVAAAVAAAAVRRAPPEHHHRVHRMPHPLARLQAVNMVGVKMPVGHPVVEQHARIARHQRRTPPALDALQLAHGVAGPVRHHEAGGILALPAVTVAAGAGDCRRLGRRPRRVTARLVVPGIAGGHILRRPFRVDGRRPFQGVLRRQHTRQRHINIIRVGDIRLPVGESHLLGLYHQVNGRGGTEAHCRQIVLPDDVQLLEQDVAAGIGRRFVHRIVAVLGGDGFLPAGVAVGQVGHRQQAALFLAETDDGGGDVAAIENLAPLRRDGGQGARQVALPEDVAGAHRLAGAVPRKDGAAGGKFAEQPVAGNGGGKVMSDGKAVLGQRNGRRQNLRQGQRPIGGVGVQPGVEQARNGDAQDAFHRNAVPVAFRRGGVGGGAGAVADAQAVVRRPVGHNKAVPAQARHQRFHYAQSGGGGNGGVKGVAALLQYAHAGLRRQGVAGADHPVAAHNHGTVGGVADAVRRSRHKTIAPVGRMMRG